MEDYRKIAIELGQTLISKAPETREDVERMLPELKESEDEKIVKELLAFFRECVHGGHILTNKEYDSWIAWLEKQAEHAKFRDSIQVGDKVTRNEDGVLVNLSQLKRVAKKDEKQGEQKPSIEMITPEESLGISSEEYNKIVDECIYGEQKPAWSEEDEVKINRIVACLENLNVADNDILLKDVNWLKSLKDRLQPQPKQEWSEEDETVLNNLIYALANDRIDNYRDEYVDWLKSIKDRVQPQQKQGWSEEDKERYISCLQRLGTGNPEQPETINSKWFKEHVYPKTTWKPSDEQMKALNTCIMQGEISYVGQGTELQSLYNDLKKLTE